MLDFSQLATPGDGEILTAPAPSQWAKLIQSNRERFTQYRFQVAGVAYSDLRAAARCRVGADPKQPIIALGHQPEFLHAGVWAKYIAVDRAARRLGGKAVNLVADSDAPREVALRIPVESGGTWTTRKIELPQRGAGRAYECIPAWTDEEIEQVRRDLQRQLGSRFERSLLPQYLGGLSAAPAADWVAQQCHARRQLEHRFGMSLVDLRVSDAWNGPLLVQMIQDAPRFAQTYNAVLATYRSREGIKGDRHPMPDLEITSERVEIPLWAYDVSSMRQRVFVGMAGSARPLFAGKDVIGEWPGKSSGQGERPLSLNVRPGIRVRPRALMLTLWARLFLTDLFVHGIGGAKYDRITDLFIERYFGCAPPEMACVSASIYLNLPVKAPDLARATVLDHALRDVRYNAGRYLPAADGVQQLIAAKHKLVLENARLRCQRSFRPLRRTLFQQVHELNGRLNDLAGPLRAQWVEERAAIDRQAADWAVAHNREYFIGLFSEQELGRFVERFS